MNKTYLLADIIPYFCEQLGKMSQNLSSAAVVICALRDNIGKIRLFIQG